MEKQALNPAAAERLGAIKKMISSALSNTKAKAVRTGVHAAHAGVGASQGLSDIGTTLLDDGVRAGIGKSLNAYRPSNIMADTSAQGIGRTVGRILPTAVPAGATLAAITEGLKTKEASERRDVVRMLEGFVEKCAEFNQDPEEMWKVAFELSNIGNYFGSNPKSVPLAPGRQGFGGAFTNLRRRFGAAWERGMHGDQGVLDYTAQQREADTAERAGHRAVQESAAGRSSLMNEQRYNPYTGQMEGNLANRERFMRERNAPYLAERAKTRMQNSMYSGMGQGMYGGYLPAPMTYGSSYGFTPRAF